MNQDELQSEFLVLKGQIDSLEELLQISQKKEQIAQFITKTSDPDFWSNQKKATAINLQLSSLQSVVDQYEQLKQQTQELQELVRMSDSDELLQELGIQYQRVKKQYQQLEVQTLLSGKYDGYNAVVSFQAGAGGTEAQDWAEMLLRMILRYAENQGWKATIIDETKGQEAGIKSATVRIEGTFVFGYLQSEHGTHRLVRISPFDSAAARHTSFASIEVIPEIEETRSVQIDPNDLRIDTFMSSGKGGQSVNTTYSAVRIVHIPTNIMVQCQNERSQLQNKETAMKILQSKLQLLKDKEEEEKMQKLRGEVKKVEWGSQIRSYVLHPYKMVKDLRTHFESSNPEAVLNGELQDFSEAYLRYKKQHDTVE